MAYYRMGMERECPFSTYEYLKLQQPLLVSIAPSYEPCNMPHHTKFYYLSRNHVLHSDVFETHAMLPLLHYSIRNLLCVPTLDL